MDRRLGRLDREAVHHLDGRRHDAVRDDSDDTAPPASSIVSNAASSVSTASGLRSMRSVAFVTTAERSLRSDEHAEQVEPRRIERRAADGDQLAVRQHRLDAEHVVHGEAVLQAVRAAGVLGDVAADRADLLARRIRRVVVAERRDLSRDLEVGDARLDRDAPIRDVDLEHAIQPSQRDDDAAAGGSAPPDSPVPCPRATNGTPAMRTDERPAGPAPPSRAARRPPAWRAGAAARRTRSDERRRLAQHRLGTADVPERVD